METLPIVDEAQGLIELKAVRTHYRGVRFDLTHENPDLTEEQSYHEPNTLVRNHWSSSTQRVLSSMPSRSIRCSQGVLSQYQNRSTQMRRRRQTRSTRPHSTTPRSTNQDVFIGLEDCTVSQNEGLLMNLQGLSAEECVRLLREMPLSISEKRELRALVYFEEAGQDLSENKDLCCHQFQACLLNVLCGSWLGKPFQQKSIQLWEGVLKNISARFGTGILSYFLFLRTLLHYNILLFFINGLFLFLPQVINPPSLGPTDGTVLTDRTVYTTGLELLTGTGFLRESVMFYGYYANSTSEKCRAENKMCPENYNMPLAFIFSIGMGLFITCVMLVYSMSKSFGRSFCIIKSKGNLALKVFGSWDFKVSRKRSVKLQSVNICIQLKEMLSELSYSEQRRNLSSKLGWLSAHLIVWTICLLSIAFSVVAVNHYIDQKVTDPVSLLILPLVVSGIGHLLPGFFNMLSRAEHYESPNIHIYISIIRNLLLKGCMFSVLCYHWLGNIAAGQEGKVKQCWETFVGQELYRLVLMDLVVAVLYIIFGEFLWGLCTRNMSLRRRKLVFDIAQNVLELIYGQMLVWLGLLFAPLLPAVQTGKLFLLFYTKETSLMVNFQPPRKHWRSSQMTTVFTTLLFFPSFLVAVGCVVYTMWRIRPSTGCGPFRNLNSMFLSGKQWIKDLKNTNPSMAWLSWAYTHLVDNPLFLFIVAGLLIVIIYIHTQVLDGQKKIIAKLQEQIDYEGEDKKFLIAKLQALNE